MKKPVYIRCPRCELNYIQKKDKFCPVCKADMEAKHEDDEDLDLELCPICKTNYIQSDEIMCASCLKERHGEDSDDVGDWEDYMVSSEDEDSLSIYDDLGDMASVNELSKAGILDDDDMDDEIDFDEEEDLGFGEEGIDDEPDELDEDYDGEDDFEEDYDDLDDDFDDDDDDEEDDFDDDDE